MAAIPLLLTMLASQTLDCPARTNVVACEEVARFRELHVSNKPQDAAGMLVRDPEFLLGKSLLQMPKMEFVNWTRTCSLFSDDWVPFPEGQVAARYVWLSCPEHPSMDKTTLNTLSSFIRKDGRVKIRFGIMSNGHGIVITMNPDNFPSKNGDQNG